MAHPSLLKVPDDLEKLLATSKAPLLVNSAEVDQMYPQEAQAKGDEILGDGKYAPGYKRTLVMDLLDIRLGFTNLKIQTLSGY